jgi:hypothetical protein
MLFCHVEQWGERGREADAEAPEPGSHDFIPALCSAVATGGDPLARLRSRMRPAYLPEELALGGHGRLPIACVGARTLPPTELRRGGGRSLPPETPPR